MTTELQDALREATAGDFDLLGGLGSGDGWAAELARAAADGSLALLVVDDAGGGEMEVEVIASLDEGVELGRTTCPACGTHAPGFPRACPACARALPGTPDPAVAGLSPAELLDEVRAAAEGGFEVLGSLSHPGGASALYFARDLSRRRIVGLALHADVAGGEHSLVVAWEPEPAPEASVPPFLPDEPHPGTPELHAREPDEGVSWTPPPPPLEIPRDSPRWRRRSGETAAYAAAAVLGIAAVGGLAYLLVARGPHPSGGENDQTVKTAILPTPQAPPPPPVDTPAPGAELPPFHLPPPPPPPPPPVVPAAPTAAENTTQAATQPTVAPAAPVVVPAMSDAARVEQALGRYVDAVASRQTSQIRSAYPGITRDQVAGWERLFASLGDRPLRVSYEVDRAPDVQGDAATVLFTLVLEYDGAAHPYPLKGTLRRGDGGWQLREVGTFQ